MEVATSREAGLYHGRPLVPWKGGEIAGYSRTFESGMFSVHHPNGEMSGRAVGGGTDVMEWLSSPWERACTEKGREVRTES